MEGKRVEGSLLTGDLNRSGLPSNLTWSRPSHALALESLPPEVLLDLVPRHVQLDLDDPRPGTRVDEILLLRTLGPLAVAAKVHLRRKDRTVACVFVCRSGNRLSSLNAVDVGNRNGDGRNVGTVKVLVGSTMLTGKFSWWGKCISFRAN